MKLSDVEDRPRFGCLRDARPSTFQQSIGAKAEPARQHVRRVPQPEGGYFVECPSLPGCYSQGESVDDALTNIGEAISLALEDMTARGEPIPEPSSTSFAQVRVAG
ncbi:MAG TPA: type II toxin-antitoxin system HicB family antitoxin [Phycisphaerales bacterium]|nr:type II toxin-antitoxin system HicB family antitoxin [Phycisphaerales bacterium]